MKIFQFRSIEHRSNTNRATIEYQSSQADSNQKLLLQFRSIERLIRLIENLEKKKNQFFEKQSILIQKLLKVQCFMNKMHKYEMKIFSKTLEFNPDLPKTRFSINLSLNLKL